MKLNIKEVTGIGDRYFHTRVFSVSWTKDGKNERGTILNYCKTTAIPRYFSLDDTQASSYSFIPAKYNNCEPVPEGTEMFYIIYNFA